MEDRRSPIKKLFYVWAALSLAGLALSVAGVIGMEREASWGAPLFYSGLGAVGFAFLALCVCGVVHDRALKRARAKTAAALAENEGLLFDTVVRFTERGMELPQEDEVFSEETLCIPAERLKVYRVLEYASPKGKAREGNYLVFPVPDGGEEELVSAPLDEKTERLALAHGAEEKDKRFPSAAGKRVHVFRFFGRTQRRWVIALSVLFVLLLGAAVGFGVWLSVTAENFSAGAWGGVCGGAAVPFALACGSVLRRDGIFLYEGGVCARFTARGGFYLPYGAIEFVSRGERTVELHAGYCVYYLPECGGLYEALRARYPEKKEEEA